jgi:hypothetical protein
VRGVIVLNVNLYNEKARNLMKNGFYRKSHHGRLSQWTKGEMILETSWLTDSSITFKQFVIEIEKMRVSLYPVLGIDVYDELISELRRKKVQFLKENGFKHVKENTGPFAFNFEKTYPETNAKDLIFGYYLEDTCTWDHFQEAGPLKELHNYGLLM